MKKALPFLFFLLLFSCKKGHRTDCLKGTGNIASEMREVGSFSGLMIQSNLDVELIESSENYIEITTGENLIDGIYAEVENNVLVLRNENKCNFVRSFNTPFNIKVYGKVTDIWHQSDGILSSQKALLNDTIYLHLEGNKVDLKLDNEYFFCDMYRTGSVSLSGNCSEISIELTSFGSFYGDSLNCKNATVQNRGEGNIYINCLENINASIFSVGNIYISGNPKSITKEYFGTGEILKK